MQEVLVSVVVPVRDRESTIEGALKSIQAQTFGGWEVLVVDDASRDGTSDVVRALTQDDPRIRLLELDTSRGAQGARNVGLMAAVGRWVGFLDSDDRWRPRSLEARLDAAEQRRVEVVHCQCSVQRPASGEWDGFGIPPDGVPSMSGEVYVELLRRPGPMFQGLLVTRRAIENIGMLDERLVAYQEWDTSLRLARSNEFAFVPEPLFEYEDAAIDRISRKSDATARGYEQVVRKHLGEIVRHLGRREAALHFRRAASRYRAANNRSGFIRCAALSLLIDPFGSARGRSVAAG